MIKLSLSRMQYVEVRPDTDMVPEGPLRDVLVCHYFGADKLRPGARVCVNNGRYQDVFGTVIQRTARPRGRTYGVRRARRKPVTVTVEVEKTVEVEVAS